MPATKRSKPSSVRLVHISPILDCGSTPIKRVAGDTVQISAQIIATSPLLVGAAVRYRPVGHRNWDRVPLTLEETDPDHYAATFKVDSIGRWQYVVEAWVDRSGTWRDALRRRKEGGQSNFDTELAHANRLFATNFLTVDEALASNFEAQSDLVESPSLFVDVDPPLARFGAWYEVFPRSFGGLVGVRTQLPRLAELGFDVLYLTPIHPIGEKNRKGRNNSLTALPGDPGSPWAIGDPNGGHTAVHQELGKIEDFDLLVKAARQHEIEIALDLAWQCSPDHPWLNEHPEWFSWRDDGTIEYAENPPKRYEDIVNFNFESDQWRELWDALIEVVRFWVSRGVRVFRVDNPHTKPLGLWEELISKVRTLEPRVLFLAEAFTRPAMMKALAKAGFSQSYTYFTWRNTRRELEDYIGELSGEMIEYFRPNFFANTPDILSSYLQDGGRAAFVARAVLAATLSPTYGIYSGFEHFEGDAVHAGSEEYLDSEKYEIKERTLDGPLLPMIAKLNWIRRSSSAFHVLNNVRFLETANEQIIGYLKTSPDNREEIFIICINLDARRTSEGLIEIPFDLGLPAQFRVTDALDEKAYVWNPGGNYVQLGPGVSHVMRVG